MPRHRVHSRVMCWQTVDRAIALAECIGRPADPSWHRLRATIAADVPTHGWNPDVRAFTASSPQWTVGRPSAVRGPPAG
ncbi:hypothetical protein GCM10011609_02420 [Lentzea pudingi]|uniref:Uncharacterized protein n=1 Tax=Lentzea pudingi TaxID=1789439 RepID=A0ABQ2HA28_9PSEU|nr:hypothetical protein GCM10011609_02420 [Lentzea pudingi]